MALCLAIDLSKPSGRWIYLLRQWDFSVSTWTLTPDGLKTDDQLWADDFLLTNQSCFCGHPLRRAGIGKTCQMISCDSQPGAIECSKCDLAWCRECLGEDDTLDKAPF